MIIEDDGIYQTRNLCFLFLLHLISQVSQNSPEKNFAQNVTITWMTVKSTSLNEYFNDS